MVVALHSINMIVPSKGMVLYSNNISDGQHEIGTSFPDKFRWDGTAIHGGRMHWEATCAPEELGGMGCMNGYFLVGACSLLKSSY